MTNRGLAAVLVCASTGCASLAGYDQLQVEADSAADADAPDANAAAPDAAAPEAAAPEAAADVDAGPFTPAQLGARLVVWLDAAKGVTSSAGKVSRWADGSGSGNDAVQADPSRQPALQDAAITFDGVASGLSIADADALRWGSDDYTVEVVAAYTNVPSTDDVAGYGALWTKETPAYPYPGVGLFANSPAKSATSSLLAQVKTFDDTPRGWVNSAADGLNDGKLHVFGTRRVAKTTLEARVDGAVTTATVATVDVSTGGQPVWIGSREGTLQLLKGQIAEVVACRGALSDAEVASLEAYLRTKYAR